MKLRPVLLVCPLLLTLGWDASPCSACTPISGVVVAAPSSGPVPLSTRIRVAVEGYPSEFEAVELVRSDATRVPLTLELQHNDTSPQRGYRFVYAAPETLAAGTYHLELKYEGGVSDWFPEIQFEGTGAGLALSGTPVFEGTTLFGDSDYYEWGYECGGYSTYARATWTLPVPPSAGWIAEAINVTTGTPIAWEELARDRQLYAYIDGPVDSQACFGLKIYDFEHREVWSQTYPCVTLTATGDTSPTPNEVTPTPSTLTPTAPAVSPTPYGVSPTPEEMPLTPTPGDEDPGSCACRSGLSTRSGSGILLGVASLLIIRGRRKRGTTLVRAQSENKA